MILYECSFHLVAGTRSGEGGSEGISSGWVED
jgi:hypothetical protein